MKKIIISFILGAVLFGGAGVYAAGGAMIEVFYNIKDIKINKVSKMPTEKPFTYKGTTYVPIRYLSESMGLDVKWDNTTQTVHIGEMEGSNSYYPEKDIKHMNYQTGYSGNSYSYKYNSSSQIQDNIGSKYSSYILSKISTWANYSRDEAWNLVEFPLNGQYKEFNTKFGLTSNSRETTATGMKLEVYLDNNKTQEYIIKPGEAPKQVNINIHNANKIGFKFSRLEGTNYNIEAALFDAHFNK